MNEEPQSQAEQNTSKDRDAALRAEAERRVLAFAGVSLAVILTVGSRDQLSWWHWASGMTFAIALPIISATAFFVALKETRKQPLGPGIERCVSFSFATVMLGLFFFVGGISWIHAAGFGIAVAVALIIGELLKF